MVHSKVHMRLMSLGHGPVTIIHASEIIRKPLVDSPNLPNGNKVELGIVYSETKGCNVRQFISDIVLTKMIKKHLKTLDSQDKMAIVKIRLKITRAEQLEEDEKTYLKQFIQFCTGKLPKYLEKRKPRSKEISGEERTKRRKITRAIVALAQGNATSEDICLIFSDEQVKWLTEETRKALKGKVSDLEQNLPEFVKYAILKFSQYWIQDHIVLHCIPQPHRMLYLSQNQGEVYSKLDTVLRNFPRELGKRLEKHSQPILPKKLIRIVIEITPDLMVKASKTPQPTPS